MSFSLCPATTGLAGVYQREGKFREALKTYQTVLQSNPDCPADVRVGIGYCLAHLDRTPQVIHEDGGLVSLGIDFFSFFYILSYLLPSPPSLLPYPNACTI